jgi:hypothetical protein
LAAQLAFQEPATKAMEFMGYPTQFEAAASLGRIKLRSLSLRISVTWRLLA